LPYRMFAPIMNIPANTWQQVYGRLVGVMQNLSAAASTRFSGVAPPLPVRVPPPFAMPRTAMQPETIQYVLTGVDIAEARDLAADLKLHSGELKCRDHNADRIAKEIDCAATACRPRVIELVLLNGLPGTGKSFHLANLLRGYVAAGLSTDEIRVHTWSQSLRRQVRSALRGVVPNATPWNFPSNTRPLYENSTGTIVFDDAGLLWPGFIPLVLAANPGINRVVCTFDSAQARVAFPQADALSRLSRPTVEWLAKLSTRYATDQRRLTIENSALFGLPRPLPIAGYAPTRGNVVVVSNPPAGIPFFAASPRFVNTVVNGGRQAISFGDSQGLSLDSDICVDLGGLSASMTDALMWTVITRSRGTIFLMVGPSMPGPSLLTEHAWGHSRIISAILAVASMQQTAVITPAADPHGIIARAVRAHLAECLTPQARGAAVTGRVQPMVAGWADYSQNPRATGPNPWTGLTYIDNLWTNDVQRSLLGTHNPPSGSAFDFIPPPALPGESNRHATFRSLLAPYTPIDQETQVSADPPARPELPPMPIEVLPPSPDIVMSEVAHPEDREVVDPRSQLPTQQVSQTGSMLPLHHSRRDPATFNISMAKRIHPKKDSPTLNAQQLRVARSLQHGFRKFFTVPESNLVDEAIFHQALTERLRSWAGNRTIRDLRRIVDQSPPDWDPLFTKLFLKSQMVKKLDKVGGPAKPGQIVTTFPLLKTFRDGVWALYVEKQLLASAHPSTYLHCRAGYKEMSTWYRTFWRPGVSTANDYTAWDSGCDATFLHFDRWLMRSYGVPQSYIELYTSGRVNTRSMAGPMPIMQFSGDRWTWLLNTARNAALTGISLEVAPRTPAAFSGDDSILLGDLPPSRSFNPRSVPMSPKPVRASVQTFCGFEFGGVDVTISPTVCLLRARIGAEQGRRDSSFWDSIDYACRLSVDAGTALPETTAAYIISLEMRSRFRLPSPRFRLWKHKPPSLPPYVSSLMPAFPAHDPAPLL